MMKKVVAITRQFTRSRGDLIPILQKVQEAKGYLSPEAVAEISRFLDISENDIYSVASFYAQFRFTRPGEHTVKVCLGVACVGCCALAPVVVLDEDVYGKLEPAKVKDVLALYKKRS